MGKITRTYPTPDTDREQCGPRERAMAVYKYLFGFEPEEAIRHPRFSMIVAGFEQQRRMGIRQWGMRSLAPRTWLERIMAGFRFYSISEQAPELAKPLESEAVSEFEVPLPNPANIISRELRGEG